MSATTSVLDASALLAYLHDEPGAPAVTLALAARATMSTVNWAEVLSTLATLGQTPETVTEQLVSQRILGEMLTLHDFDDGLAQEVARLRPLTKSLGLSIGDHACLALAKHLNLPAVTTDQTWGSLTLGVDIQLVR